MKQVFILFTALFLLQFSFAQKHDLEVAFKQPPTKAKPYVWWHWMGSNFSKVGITKDLEAMKAQGIGGATIFNLTSAVQESHFPTLNNPWPHQTYRSPAYWESLRFAAAEADRLGLEIGLHNTVGYSTTGGPWIDEERSMQRLVWSDSIITGGKQIQIKLPAPALIADEGWGKTGRTISFYKDVVVLAVPAHQKKIESTDVQLLTSNYDPQQGLQWNVPAGDWKIYRIGHASTGRPPHPIPDDLLGQVLEVDKMSVLQNTYHWDNVLNPLNQALKGYVGKSFKHMLIDSYEAGGQNWTPNFREEFIKRKGYDPIPWLASFSHTVGTETNSPDRRIINTAEQTARFDWDYRDVIEQLFYEHGWTIGKQKLAAANLDLQMEPYGGPFNTPQNVVLADLPMAEFWTAGVGGISPQVPAAARAAGKRVVGAEAFTGRPEVSQYTEDPAFLKSTADKVFTQGINRMILHHWVHQPFDDKYQPGMGMGWWGTHFGRHQTWFEPGKAFFQYLGRCQALLQAGEEVAEYLCVDKLVGHADLISMADFLTMSITIKNKKIVLPTGRTYSFIVFSDSLMLPETVQKIRSLLEQGATVVAPKPTHSPSLKNYPACDQTIAQWAKEIWDGKAYPSLHLQLAAALESVKPKKYFEVEAASNKNKIKWLYRKVDSTHIFFVSNQSDSVQIITLSFNIQQKQPELWQAEDGSISNAPVWYEQNGRTFVQLKLKGIQSVFVVFRKAALPKKNIRQIIPAVANDSWAVETTPSGSTVLTSAVPQSFQLHYTDGKQKQISVSPAKPIELSGAWNITFKPKLDTAFKRVFPSLVDFSQHNDKAIKYFAGNAQYTKTFDLPVKANNEAYILDLGELNDIASVRVNGKNVGVLWYPPYTVDITHQVKAGINQIDIIVTNNWANRLIGDEQEEVDFEWGKDRGEKMGRAMLAYPDWFIKNQPRPVQSRKTFSVWYYYRNNSPLKPAGLVGPVKIIRASRVVL